MIGSTISEEESRIVKEDCINLQGKDQNVWFSLENKITLILIKRVVSLGVLLIRMELQSVQCLKLRKYKLDHPATPCSGLVTDFCRDLGFRDGLLKRELGSTWNRVERGGPLWTPQTPQ